MKLSSIGIPFKRRTLTTSAGGHSWSYFDKMAEPADLEVPLRTNGVIGLAGGDERMRRVNWYETRARSGAAPTAAVEGPDIGAARSAPKAVGARPPPRVEQSPLPSPREGGEGRGLESVKARVGARARRRAAEGTFLPRNVDPGRLEFQKTDQLQLGQLELRYVWPGGPRPIAGKNGR